MNINDITQSIIGAAIEVHRELGPGLLESGYEAALAHELRLRGHVVLTQVHLPITYKDLEIPSAYRLDLIVDDAVIIELKTVESIKDVHKAQVLTYLKMADKKVGLLINFHVSVLKDGIRRLVNNL